MFYRHKIIADRVGAISVGSSGAAYCFSSMSAMSFTEREIITLIYDKVKNKESAGPDGIQLTIFKKSAVCIAAPLTFLVNSSFESEVFPLRLTSLKVVPVFKRGDPSLAANYRPFALTS